MSFKMDKDMRERHLEDALNLQKKAKEKLQSIDPLKLTNSEAIRFLTAGADLERLVRKTFTPKNDDTQDVIEDLRKVKEFFDA